MTAPRPTTVARTATRPAVATPTVALLAGDGIGPEIVAQAVKVLEALRGPDFDPCFVEAPVGAAAYDIAGHPLPPETLALARRADAVLFGAVGDPRLDHLEPALRPERAILGLRRELGLYAALKQITVPAGLAGLSPLRDERVAGVDLLVVRELDGDVYTGQPRGMRHAPDGPFAGDREGFDTMRYAEGEVRRIGQLAFQAARRRRSPASAASTRRTCWQLRACGGRSCRRWDANTRTSSSVICTPTAPPCN